MDEIKQWLHQHGSFGQEDADVIRVEIEELIERRFPKLPTAFQFVLYSYLSSWCKHVADQCLIRLDEDKNNG